MVKGDGGTSRGSRVQACQEGFDTIQGTLWATTTDGYFEQTSYIPLNSSSSPISPL